MEILTNIRPKQAFLDRGYKAAFLGQQTEVNITSQKRQTAATKRWMKRRNAMWRIIDHLE